MLNPFPELLSFGLLAPFILRIVGGFIFLNLGFLKLKGEKSRWEASFDALGIKPKAGLLKAFAFTEILGGLALIAGFYTQIAALVFVVITFIELFIEQKESSFLKRDVAFYLLMFAIVLSLLFSGAGFFAFDLPL